MVAVNIFERKQIKQAGQEQENPGLPDKEDVCNGLTQEKIIKIVCEKIDDRAESGAVHPDT